MRRPLLAGNMKMFKTRDEVKELLTGLRKEVAHISDREILMCPSFVSLHAAREVLKGSHIFLGAQNVFWESEGAFTGEVSAEMLRDCGCTHIIVGHSERRRYFGDTDEACNKKVRAVFRVNLIPILCVGEKLSQRESGSTFTVIETQLNGSLKDIPLRSPDRMVIAYEPVWAIGTGKTATPEQAQEVHRFIRGKLAVLYGHTQSQQIRILYGGSVKPNNIKTLMAQPDIDGALVGGACLKVDQFLAIVQY